jgi:hypothetical protein
MFASNTNRNINHEVKEKTMRTMKRLSAAVVLTLFLGLSVLAGETPTPPCAPPEPGQTETPPCGGGQAAGSATPGIVSSTRATDAGTGYLLADAAISLFESLLPIF